MKISDNNKITKVVVSDEGHFAKLRTASGREITVTVAKLDRMATEHAALLEVESALMLVFNDTKARFSTVHKGQPVMNIVRNALYNLKAARAEVTEPDKAALWDSYDQALRAYNEAHRVRMNTPVAENKRVAAELAQRRAEYEAAREAYEVAK